MKLFRSILILVALAAPAFAQHRADDINVTFPTELGGLPFRGVQTYPQAGFGYSIRYEQGPLRADIFVYTRNVAGIGDGPNDPAVVREFAQSRQEAMAGYQARNEQATIALADGVINTGVAPRQFQWRAAEFRAVINGQPVHSYLLVTGLRGQFIKIRVTHPEGMNPRAFGDALGNLLADAAGTMATPPATPGK